MYQATITIEGNPDDMYKLFKVEESQKDRSSFTIEKQKDGIKFEIKSSDSVALRATLNTITKLMTIYEKTK